MSYAERRLRKMRRAKTPQQLHYGHCRVCMESIKPCGPNCIHRRLNLCKAHLRPGDGY